MAASPEQPSTDFEDTLRQDQIRDLERLLLGESGQIVSLSGAPGSGKTSLAAYFAEAHKGRFPGGAPIFPASLMGIDGGAAILSQLQAEDSVLLVLDEADRVPVNLLADLIRRIREDYPLASVLMTSSVPLTVGGSGHSVAMPPLSTSQILTLLTRQVNLTSHDAEELAGLLAGNAAAVAAVSHRLASGMPAERILEWLKGGHLPVAVDASGRELAASSPEHARLSLVVNEISEELIGELAANPKLLYELDPRKFEKLVAQLYRRQGFDTTLTPSTGDEGVDIYVVSSNELGRTLWVVQAKRYAAKNRIEAGVVRELYGTVMAKEASAGVLVTTSFFQPGAERLERRFKYRLSLKDYLDLRELLRMPARSKGNAR